jgi:hypothetical protein
MKCFYAQSVAWALGLAWLASPALAQYPSQTSLLPIPAAAPSYNVAPVEYRGMLQGDQVPAAPRLEASPSDAPSILPAPPMAQPDQSVLSEDYRKAASSGWGGNDVTYDNSSCGPDACTPCENYWYGSAGGLIMTRAQSNHFLITGDTAGTRLLCSCEADMGWTGGVDVTLGRTFNCGNNAIQFTYWGLYPSCTTMDAYASTLGNQLVSGIDFTGATYNGNAVTDITNNSFRQQAIFKQSLHNFEANLLGQCFGNGFIGGGMASCQNGHCGSCGPGYCGPRWGCGWMMGVRYFQFDNSFNFNVDGGDEYFNDDIDELCYHVYLENRLWGFQVGGGWNWNIFDCFQIYGLAKAGIYNNSIDQEMYLHGAAGDGQFGDGSTLNVNNNYNRLAMIGQLDLGARWQFSQCFSVNAGYRIVGISGVALVEHQIPTDFNDSYYASKVEADGSLLLHGAYIGGEFRF